VGENSRWTPYPKLPSELGEVAAAIVGDVLFVVGQGKDDTYGYHLSRDVWLKYKTRPFNGHHHAAAAYNDKFYLLGGLSSDAEGKTQIFDPQQNRWTEGKALPEPVGSPAAAVVKGTLRVCGGLRIGSRRKRNRRGHNSKRQDKNLRNCWFMDAKGSWVKFAPMVIAVNHGATGTDGEMMYIFGGRTIAKNALGNGIDTLQIYNPTIDRWAVGPEMPFGRGGHGNAPFLNGLLYIFGGEQSSGPHGVNGVFPQVHVYNPTSNAWGVGGIADMPIPTHGIFPVADTARDRIYIVGGGTKGGFSDSDWFQTLSFRSTKSALPPGAPPPPPPHTCTCLVARRDFVIGNLTCPPGQVIAAIKYAKYGFPKGSCGSYEVGVDECTTDMKSSTMLSRCLGKERCEVNLESEVMESKCNSQPGNILAVEAVCSQLSAGSVDVDSSHSLPKCSLDSAPVIVIGFHAPAEEYAGDVRIAASTTAMPLGVDWSSANSDTHQTLHWDATDDDNDAVWAAVIAAEDKAEAAASAMAEANAKAAEERRIVDLAAATLQAAQDKAESDAIAAAAVKSAEENKLADAAAEKTVRDKSIADAAIAAAAQALEDETSANALLAYQKAAAAAMALAEYEVRVQAEADAAAKAAAQLQSADSITEHCEDSTTWTRPSGKGCGFVSNKPNKRCNLNGVDGTKSGAHCKKSCGTC
jgi:N-acetylneuraminic acid mutarotase